MKIINSKLSINTNPKCLNDISLQVVKSVNNSGIKNGNCTLYIKHTSASLVIQENADPAVLRDIESFFKSLVSEDENLYEHNSEGPDDMPAHIRSILTNTSLSIPIINSKGAFMGKIIKELKSKDINLELIDMGGGLGINYEKNTFTLENNNRNGIGYRLRPNR